MPLSSYQKLRLQQLQVPQWELRSKSVTVLEESSISDAKTLNPLKVIASFGEQPAVFFWIDDCANFSETFIKDLVIGLNQKNSAWMQYSGDKVLFEEFLSSLPTRHIAIFISNQFQTVKLLDSKPTPTSAKQSAVEIYLPASPKDLLQFKKQLWGAVYQSCYH